MKKVAIILLIIFKCSTSYGQLTNLPPDPGFGIHPQKIFKVYVTTKRRILEVDLASTNPGNNSLVVFNKRGKLVAECKTNEDATVYFNVARLVKGVYYIRVADGGSGPVKFSM